jgi:DNA-binding NarL/FixJ family response regulator
MQVYVFGFAVASNDEVKIHLHNIYQKVGVGSRIKLARYAREKGLV